MSQSSERHSLAPAAHPAWLRYVLVACLFTVFLGLLALGSWQVKRLFWKRELIERVERRVHAPPVAAPGQQAWSQVTAQTHEYLHVRLEGNFLHAKTARVKALTALGSGCWLITPLRSADGSVTLINRGFVNEAACNQSAVSQLAVNPPIVEHPVRVTGLLRISEPDGGFLRRNDPAGDRWFSRDVPALAAARQLSTVAPYFVDADSNTDTDINQSGSAGAPVGGLTVIAFPNNHLVYALTWYALALMMVGFWIMRKARHD